MEPRLHCPKCSKDLADEPNFCPACGEDLRGLTPTADTLSGPWSGRVIDGRYKLLEKLGEGGMGAVFKVEHARMGKVLALKLLRPDVALDKKLKARFLQEARVVAKLSHANTIQVFDCGELEDGSLYIAMEFVPGRDLAWLLRAHGPVAEERALSIGLQVLSSLSEAHAQGIVHRDIKPANVMLVRRTDREDVVKVLDFGIAKLVEAEGRKHITGVTDFLGTPAYMAPEMARGDPVDHRADLYSVGAMLYELVSGRLLFDGPTPMAIVTKHLTDPVPRLADAAPGKHVSSGFEAVLKKSLEKKPEHRYPDAEAMKVALERARREVGGLGQDVTPVAEELTTRMASRADFDRFERGLKVRRLLAPFVAVAGLSGLVGGGFYLYQRAVREANAQSTHAAEREPNHLPQYATRIALGTGVSGTMGEGVKEGQSDVDLFVVELSTGPLRASVTGVEDLNLVVELLEEEPSGKRLVPRLVLDDVGEGLPERVDGFWPRSSRLFVRVSEGPFYADRARPPRQQTTKPYELRVEAMAADGYLEREPNDTPEQAQKVVLDRALSGYAGAVVPVPPSRRRGQAFSAPDLYVLDAPGAKGVKALVVPASARVGAVDLRDVEDTLAQELKGGRVKEVWLKTDAKPFLLPLKESPRGHGLWIQPTADSAPGATYFLAFLADQDGGLSGAIDLANRLLALGRGAEATAVLELVAKAAPPHASQLPQIHALLKGATR